MLPGVNPGEVVPDQVQKLCQFSFCVGLFDLAQINVISPFFFHSFMENVL